MDYKERMKSAMAAVFDVNVEDIDENTSQKTMENWDSIKHMNLVIALEKEFDIRFDDDEIADLLNWKIIEIAVRERISEEKNNGES